MKSAQRHLFAALSIVSMTTQAGVVIEYVNRNATTGKEEPLQTVWIQNGLARMESNRGRSGTVATLYKNEAMYVIEDASRSYRVIDQATMEQMAGRMGDAMAKMREQMAKMPPEQRAMMEQMMKQRGGTMMNGAPHKPAIYDAQATGGSETVNGRSCKLWNVTRDGALAQQLCVVPMAAMPGAVEVIELSKKMSALFEKLGHQLRDQLPTTLQQSTTALAKINGYPIMTRAYRDGVLQPEQFIVKDWKQQSIDAAKFEIPTGYKQQEMPKMPK